MTDQTREPIYEALDKLRRQRVVPFDVPGTREAEVIPNL